MSSAQPPRLFVSSRAYARLFFFEAVLSLRIASPARMRSAWSFSDVPSPGCSLLVIRGLWQVFPPIALPFAHEPSAPELSLCIILLSARPPPQQSNAQTQRRSLSRRYDLLSARRGAQTSHLFRARFLTPSAQPQPNTPASSCILSRTRTCFL